MGGARTCTRVVDRGNQEWTIQRNWQHMVRKTQNEDKQNDEQHEPTKTWGKPRCSRRVSNSFLLYGTPDVTNIIKHCGRWILSMQIFYNNKRCDFQIALYTFKLKPTKPKYRYVTCSVCYMRYKCIFLYL